MNHIRNRNKADSLKTHLLQKGLNDIRMRERFQIPDK